MATFLSLLYITAALLLSATTTAAQDEFVRNFQVSSRNDTHITFSWDIVDGSSATIDSFVLLQRDRSSAFGENGGLHITYDDVNLNKAMLPHFEYTTTVLRFGTNGYYLLWLVVNRNGVTPTQTFSRQIYVEVGRWIVIEMNIRLWPLQTCYEFIGQSNDLHSAVSNEVYYALRKHCECIFSFISQFDVNNVEFTCLSSRYATVRAHLYSYDNTVDPSALNTTMYNWLYGEDTEKSILLYTRRYTVEPGTCGITVPYLLAPHCVSEEPEIVVAPTDSATSYSIIVNNPPSTDLLPGVQSTSVYVPTDPQSTTLLPYTTHSGVESSAINMAVSPSPSFSTSSVGASQGGASNLGAEAANNIQLTQDHVVIIVVSVCATMLFTLILALLGCILVLILVMRLKHMSTKAVPAANGYWRSNDDTAWVISPTHDHNRDDDDSSIHKEVM